MSEVSILFSAGAIGFITAVFSPIVYDLLRNCWYGPILSLEFDSKSADCKNFAPEGRGAQSKGAYYIRVKVSNKGRHIAKQCRAFLVNVEKYNRCSKEYEKTTYCESIALVWSASGTGDAFRAIDIPQGINQFVDVVSTITTSCN